MSLLFDFYFKAKGDLQEPQFLDLYETDKKKYIVLLHIGHGT